ncbi:MAG: ribosome-binding factor A [Holosporales bacterium]|jgi:ribosome-binding factor A
MPTAITPPTKSPRPPRVASALHQSLAGLLLRGELRNPLLAEVGLTLTEVTISPDLRHAQARYTTLSGDAAAVRDALRDEAKQLIFQAAKQVGLRFVPSLRFVVDDSTRADRLEALFRHPHVVQDLKE